MAAIKTPSAIRLPDVPVGMLTGVGVAKGVIVGAGVRVFVSVSVDVGMPVGVTVGVSVGVPVGVAVGVLVGVPVAVGEPVQLTTTARDANGVTIGGAKITYTVSPAGIVNVDATGRVVGVAPGSAVITATSGGQSSPPFTITVTSGSVGGVARGT